MLDTTLIKKLGIKPGQRILILDAPEGYVEALGPLPAGAEIVQASDGSFDIVQLFVKNKAELDRSAPAAAQAVRPGGLLWISYPKRSSKTQTDLTRDVGWDVIDRLGLEGVSLISIDDVWSAARFKPAERAAAEQDPIDAQYAGPKAALRPIFDRLAQAARQLGDDVELSPRKTYVALARKKQFAVVAPSTSTRVDLGLRLKGRPASGRLAEAGGFGSGSVTHKVELTSPDQVDEELIGWLRAAYEGVA